MDFDIDRLFAKHSMIPVVVKEKGTGRVLSLAYMNKQSLKKSIETGYAWYVSRGSGQMYSKGENENSQKLYSIRADCDCDSLLIKVYQKGRVCHSGHRSCFYRRVWSCEDAAGTQNADNNFNKTDRNK